MNKKVQKYKAAWQKQFSEKVQAVGLAEPFLWVNTNCRTLRISAAILKELLSPGSHSYEVVYTELPVDAKLISSSVNDYGDLELLYRHESFADTFGHNLIDVVFGRKSP